MQKLDSDHAPLIYPQEKPTKFTKTWAKTWAKTWERTIYTAITTSAIYTIASGVYYGIQRTDAIKVHEIIVYIAMPAVVGALSGIMADRYAVQAVKRRFITALAVSLGPFALTQAILLPFKSSIPDPLPHLFANTLGFSLPFGLLLSKKCGCTPVDIDEYDSPEAEDVEMKTYGTIGPPRPDVEEV